jgi:hypothetical protein
LHKNIFVSILLQYISKEESTGSYATFENVPVNEMSAVTFTVPSPTPPPNKENYVTYQSMLPELLNSCKDGMIASIY